MSNNKCKYKSLSIILSLVIVILLAFQIFFLFGNYHIHTPYVLFGFGVYSEDYRGLELYYSGKYTEFEGGKAYEMFIKSLNGIDECQLVDFYHVEIKSRSNRFPPIKYFVLKAMLNEDDQELKNKLLKGYTVFRDFEPYYEFKGVEWGPENLGYFQSNDPIDDSKLYPMIKVHENIVYFCCSFSDDDSRYADWRIFDEYSYHLKNDGNFEHYYTDGKKIINTIE